MLEIVYAPSFVRQLAALPPDLRDEVIERAKLFRNRANHKLLKVHKLQGRLRGRFSFSVDYRTRIIFKYLDKNLVILLAIGTHEIYK